MAAIVAAAALEALMPEEIPSLLDMSVQAYLEFLEEECSGYVTLTHLDSPVLNPVKNRLMDQLKLHLRNTFESLPNKLTRRYHSGVTRTFLIKKIINGRYPSEHHRNSYNYNTNRSGISTLGDDDDNIAKELEAIKLNGRKCSSVCCTGAFLVETMLSILVNEDVTHLVFGKNIKDQIYQDKPIANFLFFDLTSILVHFVMALNQVPKGEEPALQQLILESGNLGSLSSQGVYERVLKSYRETQKYLDFPWRLSQEHSKPTTPFMMLTLKVMFDRPTGFFRHLTKVQLSGECLNTRLQISNEERGQAPSYLMSCFANSCPNLEILDLKDLSSLSPECLVYLCYKDAFYALHKYMYLPEYTKDPENDCVLFDESTEPRKHDGSKPCAWCDDFDVVRGFWTGYCSTTTKNIFVIDDRIYDFVESYPRSDTEGACWIPPVSAYLAFCVKISDLIRALDEDKTDCESSESSEGGEESIKRKIIREKSGKSSLCDSMKELLLPSDAVDSKTWLIPMFLHAMPNLQSLGKCYVFDGLKLMRDLPDIHLPAKTKFEEIDLYLDDMTSFKVHERMVKCFKSLATKNSYWSAFGSALLSPTKTAEEKVFSLERFMTEKLPKGDIFSTSDLESVKLAWKDQVQTVVDACPKLRSLHLFVQPQILTESDKSSMWRPLTLGLHWLKELHVCGSCWGDIIGVLLMIGHKLESLHLNLNTLKSLREDDITSMDFINTIPHLCPNLKRVNLGYRHGDRPQSLCTNDIFSDVDRLAYRYLNHFEVSGSITYQALCFLTQRATALQSLKITNNIVLEVSEYDPICQPKFTEVVLSPDRIETLFRFNRMSNLRIIDVPMTLSSINSASTLLSFLPNTVKSISLLQVKVAIPESGEGNESIGDQVATVLRQMVEFKLSCKKRCAEHKSKIQWTWKREGILTILLQQQIMASITELIDP